jgi:hypothetical protein
MARSSACIGLAVVLVTGCSDEKQGSGSALLDFANSGCKRERAENLASEGVVARTGQPWVSTQYAAETSGLKCIAWEAGAPGRLTVDLTNFEEACGAEWQGSAGYDPRTGLTLALTNPDCRIAKCGSCVYDWSFDVAVPDGSGPIPLRISIDRCPGEQEITSYTASLPTARPSGILCRSANWYALEQQCSELGDCGTLGMPCGTTVDMDVSCTAGLECVNASGSSDTVCIEPCGSDADCGTTGALSCEDGVCRPEQTW